MPSLEETRAVLVRHQEELDAAWAHDPEERAALVAYIERISDVTAIKNKIKSLSAEPVLFVFGGRLPMNGLEEIVRAFPDLRDRADCFITESVQSSVLNPVLQPAPVLARIFKDLGWSGVCHLDVTAENTGDQAVALVSLLERITLPRTIVVCASIDHVGRMAATFIDALESRGLISGGMSIIPFALGNWGEIYAHGFTHGELAFGYEPGQRGETGFDSDKQVLFDRLSGQYTFRWQRALQAKERGEYVGRAIVKPSQALRCIV